MPQSKASGLPRLVLTTGEPAGIGPELLVRIAQKAWPCALAVVGDIALLEHTAARMNLPLSCAIADFGLNKTHVPGRLPVIPVALPATVIAGQLDRNNVDFVLTQLLVSAGLALSGDCDAIVTNALQKSIINDAGIAFSGHTEFFAQQAGDVPVLMLLANDYLRVALLTTHLPLRAVADAVTQEKLRTTMHLLVSELRAKFAINNPRIALLGLNPHAGEGGHMGREEIDVMLPLVSEWREQGIDIQGPLSADTAFTPDRRAQFDAYLAMYHDQGLPVLKALGFHRSVNITLGLPFIRTSVDHGTAVDLAGRGIADSGSLEFAIETALRMIAQRQENH